MIILKMNFAVSIMESFWMQNGEVEVILGLSGKLDYRSYCLPG
ncbi:MAG TPA: hypothetical protein VIS54_04760 [Psychromonas sp.]